MLNRRVTSQPNQSQNGRSKPLSNHYRFANLTSGQLIIESSAVKKLPLWVLVGLIAFFYTITAKIGFLLTFRHQLASPVWPPAGIALAAVILFGYRVWPGILLGALFANAYWSGSVPIGLGISMGSALQAIVGAFLLKRFLGPNGLLVGSRNYSLFVFLGAVVSTLVSSTIGNISSCLGGIAPWSEFGSLWFTWWLGDAGGILIMVPFLLSTNAQLMRRWSIPEMVEGAIVSILLVTVTGIVFAGWFDPAPAFFIRPYLIVPFLLWAGLRFGHLGVSILILAVSVISIWGRINNFGPFVTNVTTHESLMSLQIFLAVLSISIGLLAAAISELRGVHLFLAQSQLRQSKMQLEAEALRAKELERSNEALECFAHTTSHDLQEPLRMIALYSQLLVGRLGESLDVEARAYFDNMISGVGRMQQLIHALLDYSKVGGQKKEKPQSVSLGNVLKTVLENVQAEVQKTRAVITYDELPTVTGHSVQLGQLLQNLISNALKFQSEGNVPHIHISAEKQGDCWQFSVRDNGVGFDPKFRAEVFEVFKRVHARSEYPGSGIGLATCKKIVELHGGKIWAQSRQSEGSTFFFTLPESPRSSKNTPPDLDESEAPHPVFLVGLKNLESSK